MFCTIYKEANAKIARDENEMRDEWRAAARLLWRQARVRLPTKTRLDAIRRNCVSCCRPSLSQWRRDLQFAQFVVEGLKSQCSLVVKGRARAAACRANRLLGVARVACGTARGDKRAGLAMYSLYSL